MPRSSFGSTTAPAISTTGHSDPQCLSAAILWVAPGTATTLVGRAVKVIGRDGDCDTQLAGHEVSRRHASVQLEGVLPVVRDLGSRNGLYVNGVRVSEAPLQPQSVVRVGEWVGVAVAFAPSEDPSFRPIAPGWYGGARLASIMQAARLISTTDLPVTIQGETGTGKEGVAHAIHTWSARTGKLVSVNCAAIPQNLAEAELFGYRKGAFTGADRPALGYFRVAHGGTLFLDEILDLPLPVQAKLLRALEQREVIPIGEAQAVAVDVRILAATQEPLAHAVAERRFRADLMARLDGATVSLPPLRERREDIAPLFGVFLREGALGKPPELEAKFVEQLLLYDWPLNVRELSLLARRLQALHAGERILRRSILPERILSPGGGGIRSDRGVARDALSEPSHHPAPSDMPAGVAGTTSRPKRTEEHGTRRAPADDEASFENLVNALRSHAGNVARAAASLGISRARAYRLLDARPEFDVTRLRGESGDENAD